MLGAVGIILELLAQAGNADPQYFFIVAILAAPHGGEQFLGREDMTHMVGKLNEQAIFSG